MDESTKIQTVVIIVIALSFIIGLEIRSKIRSRIKQWIEKRKKRERREESKNINVFEEVLKPDYNDIDSKWNDEEKEE